MAPFRHLRVEASADLEQAPDTAFGAYGAGGGSGDLGENLQQGALASTVLADDTHHVALFDLEVDITQGPHVFAFTLGAAVVGLTDGEVGVFFALDIDGPPPLEVVRQGTGAYQSKSVDFTDVIEFYCCCHQKLL